MYTDFMDQDITVHTENGSKYRGILRAVDLGDLLKFEVGIDTFYINARVIYAVTVHGISPVSIVNTSDGSNDVRDKDAEHRQSYGV